MIFQCSECERSFETKQGLTSHRFWAHGIRIKKKEKEEAQYNSQTLAWFEERSIQNILLQCGGDTKKLIKGQIRFLKELNIIHLSIDQDKQRNYHFTEKGLEIMKYLKQRPNLGKTFSEETKEKMSQAKKGKPHLYMQGDKHPNYGGRHSAKAWKTRRERYGPTGMKPKKD